MNEVTDDSVFKTTATRKTIVELGGLYEYGGQVEILQVDDELTITISYNREYTKDGNAYEVKISGIVPTGSVPRISARTEH